MHGAVDPADSVAGADSEQPVHERSVKGNSVSGNRQPSAGGLPVTGANVVFALGFGVVLLLVGFGLLVVVWWVALSGCRRKRPSTDAVRHQARKTRSPAHQLRSSSEALLVGWAVKELFTGGGGAGGDIPGMLTTRPQQ